MSGGSSHLPDGTTGSRAVYDLILRDATIVTSSGRLVADVAIADGRIAYVGPRPPRRSRDEIQAIGKFLIPGVIDTAVQFDPSGDPGIWYSESRAAVTGGVTTVLCLPDGHQPVVDVDSARRRIELAAGSSWCHFGLWAAARAGRSQATHEASSSGLTLGTLAHVDGNGSDADGIEAKELSEFLDCHGVLGVQLEPTDVLDEGFEQHGLLFDILGRTRDCNHNVHLVHLSTAAELQMLDPVRGDLPLTAGVTPHHLFLSRESEDGRVRTRPPVRPEHDRRTLWTAMKRGRLDCIASDHHASPGDNGSSIGVPGVELLFPLMLSAVKYGRLSLELLVSLCCESPARIFGLERKGRIVRGADADLVLFSEGEVARVVERSLLSCAGWSPYLDREAAPKPDMVIVAGEIVAQCGQVTTESPTGTVVTRD